MSSNEIVELLRKEGEAIVAAVRAERIENYLGDDSLLTEEEAARLLGVSSRTLFRMRKAGEVHCGMIAGKPRYSLGQIRRMARDTVRPR